MSEPTPPRVPVRPITPLTFTAPGGDDRVTCERCGAQMHRMHAVWRCSACSYKTDGYGW